MKSIKIFRSLFLTLTVFGLLGWLYLVVIQIAQPNLLGIQLTHIWKYPHVDTFGETSFLISFISFFIYNIIKDDKKK
jgi:hypothetical protein